MPMVPKKLDILFTLREMYQIHDTACLIKARLVYNEFITIHLCVRVFILLVCFAMPGQIPFEWDLL